MRLFKRRVSDPAPQLVSLAPINSEMDAPASTRLLSRRSSSSGSYSEDYADYQTVTAVPALVVVDDAPRKGQLLSNGPILFGMWAPFTFSTSQSSRRVTFF